MRPEVDRGGRPGGPSALSRLRQLSDDRELGAERGDLGADRLALLVSDLLQGLALFLGLGGSCRFVGAESARSARRAGDDESARGRQVGVGEVAKWPRQPRALKPIGALDPQIHQGLETGLGEGRAMRRMGRPVDQIAACACRHLHT